MPKFCMPTLCNGQNNTKTACICLYCVQYPACIGKPGTIFSACKHQANVINGHAGIPPDCVRLAEKLALVAFRLFPSGPFDLCHWVLRVSLQKCANLVTVRTDWRMRGTLVPARIFVLLSSSLLMLSGEIYLRLKPYLVVKISSDIVTEPVNSSTGRPTWDMKIFFTYDFHILH